MGKEESIKPQQKQTSEQRELTEFALKVLRVMEGANKNTNIEPDASLAMNQRLEHIGDCGQKKSPYEEKMQTQLMRIQRKTFPVMNPRTDRRKRRLITREGHDRVRRTIVPMRRQINRTVASTFIPSKPVDVPGGEIIRDYVIYPRKIALRVTHGRNMRELEAIDYRQVRKLKVTVSKFGDLFVYKIPAFRPSNEWFLPRISGMEYLDREDLDTVFYRGGENFEYGDSGIRGINDKLFRGFVSKESLQKEMMYSFRQAEIEWMSKASESLHNFAEKNTGINENLFGAFMEFELSAEVIRNVWHPAPQIEDSPIVYMNELVEDNRACFENFHSIMMLSKRPELLVERIMRTPTEKALLMMEHIVELAEWRKDLLYPSFAQMFWELLKECEIKFKIFFLRNIHSKEFKKLKSSTYISTVWL